MNRKKNIESMSKLHKVIVEKKIMSTHIRRILFIFIALQVGLGGPGHGPVFGTPFGLHLNSVSIWVSVHLDHCSVRS